MPENVENFDAEAELNKIKQEIATISTAIINARSQVETIEFYYKKFEAARTLLDEQVDAVEKAHNLTATQKAAIDTLKQEAETNLAQIKVALQNVKSSHGNMETAYKDFEQTKLKIDDPADGLVSTLAQSQQLKAAIDTLKQEAETNLAQIKVALQDVQSKLENMQIAYQDFEQTKFKIDDPSTGLNAVFTQANDFKDKISAAKISIDEILSNVSLTKKQIDKLREDAEAEWKEIVQIKESSESLKSSIGETLDLVTDSSHSNAFIRRKNSIQYETYFWGFGMMLSLAALAGAVLYIYSKQSSSIDGFQDWHQWYRYLFTSPLIFLTYICAENYNLARTYLEKYAFKGVMATTLTSYTKLFKDEFPKAEKELLQFALDSIATIYKEPYHDRDVKRKLYFSFYNVVRGGIQMDETKQVEKETKTKQVTEETVKEKSTDASI